jgi:hypothetical protein
MRSVRASRALWSKATVRRLAFFGSENTRLAQGGLASDGGWKD